MSQKKDRNIAQSSKWFSITFILLLILPNVILLGNIGFGAIESPLSNKNEKPIQLKNYYLENYGLRKSFSNTYLNLKSGLLNENPIPHRVIKGKDDWYFLGDFYNNTLTNAYGNDAFEEDDFNSIVSNITKLKNYFENKGIEFYLIVPPDKNQIYKDKLPYKLSQRNTKLDSLKFALNENLNFELVDFKNTLLKVRSTEANLPLYYKYDTHWTMYGAYYSYEYLLDVLNKDIPVTKIDLDSFTPTNETVDFDLIRMLNIKADESSKTLSNTNSNVEIIKSKEYHRYYKNASKSNKVVVYCDSFIYALLPFINESFGESIYIKDNYVLQKDIIEREKPSVVIFEVAERNLIRLVNKKPSL